MSISIREPPAHGDPLALCYHAISEHWPADLSTTPERLESQLGTLVVRGYRGVTFSELATGTMAGGPLAVTFDDGYRSVIDLALPIMRRLGLPGTVFVVTDYLENPSPMRWPGIDQWAGGIHEHELEPLSPDDLRSLADEGWEIGSHTRSHPRLTELGPRAIEHELRESRESCERVLGMPCRSIAYPYGDVNDSVIAAAATAGYSAGATLPGRFDQAGPLAWPRVGIYHSDGARRFALKVSPAIRRLRHSRAWSLLDRARSLMGAP
jgi:peptidoglycan/xylan/chitin deacetylase (PgdA/CDA1 family)